jgi:hypothetical protein
MCGRYVGPNEAAIEREFNLVKCTPSSLQPSNPDPIVPRSFRQIYEWTLGRLQGL